MPRQQLSKTLLHATATDGKTVHRWVVAAFANRPDASVFANIIKMAHASKSSDAILSVDPSTPKSADGKALTPVKLSVQEVPYAPHTRVGSALDDEEAPAPEAPAK